MIALKRSLTVLCAALLGAAAPAPAGAQEPGASLAGEPVARTDSAHPSGEVHLVVDLSDRQLHVVQGGTTLRSYDVAIGKPQHPTPRGEFHVKRIIWNPGWVPPRTEWARGKKPRAPGDPNNPMGRVKMFFQEPDYYIHGTNDEASLGHARSHGCVRMRNDDVVDLAQIVMEHGGEPRSPGWFRRVLNRIRSTQEVRLSDPVPVEIRA